ncbi:MAG: DoxX family protein [Sphingobacteriales bacterium]|nr:DoxX family protein [Sphingobacteriales bacterium]OJY84518.1 MAG: DoxX family protein [Sphingobacteriales bacterium 44-15]
MNLLHSVEKWGDAHHPKWLDIIRVVLGIFLVFKGIDFINHMDRLTDLMGRSRFLGSLSLGLLAHYIVFAHLVGGALIAAGLLTRLACLVQIPILIGAVFFINSSAGILAPYDVLWLSVIVLLLLVFFLITGSGPLSVDEQMKK